MFVGNETARAAQLALVFVAVQHLEEEGDVHGGQLERLNLAQLVRGHGRDDLPQRGEGLVQRLRSLSLSDVGEHPLILQVLETLTGLLFQAGAVQGVAVRVPLDAVVSATLCPDKVDRQALFVRLLGKLCYASVQLLMLLLLLMNMVYVLLKRVEGNRKAVVSVFGRQPVFVLNWKGAGAVRHGRS